MPRWSCSHFGPQTRPSPVSLPVPSASPAPGVSRRLRRQGLAPIRHWRAPPPFPRRLKHGGPCAEHIFPHRAAAVLLSFLGGVFFFFGPLSIYFFFPPPSEFGAALLCIWPRRCWSSRLSCRAAPARLRLPQVVRIRAEPEERGGHHACHLLRPAPGVLAAAALHQPLGWEPYR